MKTRVAALFAVWLLVAVADVTAEDAKKEWKQLAGTWELVSEVMDGKEQPAELVMGIKFFINEDGSTKVEKDGQLFIECTGKLVSGSEPKAVDWTVTTEGDQKGKVVRAIYELKDETLKHCWIVEKERPKTFASTEGSGQCNSVFKRVKK
jgi:uncharacterized protein (TIGR03067 family)